MSAINETIVREFFELQGFLVRQQRKHIAPNRPEEEDVDFFVWNPQPRPLKSPLPFLLAAADMAGISRAVVVVKGWHSETFGTWISANAPEIFRFAEPAAFERAARVFGEGGPLLKILIFPALPQDTEARQATLDLMKSKGVDAVLPFHILLADLIDRVEINRNYQKSDLLQTIRILKNYDFFKGPQLELFKPGKKKRD